VNAEIEGATTRVTYGEDGGSFEDDDRFWIVTLGDGTNAASRYYYWNYYNGKYNPGIYTDSDQKIYTTDKGNLYCAIYSLMYPYYKPTITNNIITWDTSSQEYNKGDVLYAEPVSASTESPEVTFRFRHIMSKLVFNVPEGTTSCILTGIPNTQGDFDLAKGKFLENTFTGNSSTEYNLYISSSDLEAIGYFIPQSLNHLQVKICCNGAYYQASIDLSELEASKVYSFNLGITYDKRLYIENTLISGYIDALDEEKELTGEAITPMGFTNLDEVQLYDIVLSDGSFVHSDGDNRLSEYASYARGIVFWIGNPSKEDTALGSEYMHGLILGLQEATTNGIYSWGEIRVGEIWDNESNSRTFYWPDYVLALPSVGQEAFDTMQGYTNVSSWMNKFGDRNNNDYFLYPEYQMPAYYYTWNYSASIAVATSHWYLPSIKELVYLCGGGNEDNEVDYWSEYGTSNKEQLNTILSNLSSAGASAQELSKNYYWSSLNDILPELSNNDGDYYREYNIWVVNFQKGSIESSSTYNYDAGLRAICAF
jgi:hypothetical protein